MTERKQQGEAQSPPLIGQPSISSPRYRVSFRIGGKSTESHPDYIARMLAEVRDTLGMREEPQGPDEDPIYEFVSYRSDEKKFRAWLIKEFGPVTEDAPEIEALLAEIDRSIERLRQDQSEIDRLKAETHAALERLKAA